MRALILVGCSLAACSGSDPCDGRSGTCISLTVEGPSSLTIDQLTITVDQPVVEAQSTPIRAITLPTRIGLNLPGSVDGKVNIGIVALADSSTVARGSGSSTVSHHHGSAKITLMGNAMPDLAGADLSSVVMPGQDGGGVDAGEDLAQGDLAMPTVPGAPTDVVATSGISQVTVTWNPPANNGGAPITAFVVTPSPSASPITTADGATTMAVFNGLSNGTTYTFAVAAQNAIGLGPSSTSNPATPTATPMAPTAPTMVTATADVDSGAHVSWTASDNLGSPITKYTVTSSPGNLTANTSDGITTHLVMNGLTPGTMYTFTVTSTNGVGTSPASSASTPITAATLPGAPTGVSASATGSNSIKVTWAAPASDGHSAITKYTVTSSPGGLTAATPDGSTLNATVNGLSAGVSYTFTVVASNGIGNGPASLPSSAIVLPMRDVLIVATASTLDFFDGYSSLADGTSTPTRSLTISTGTPVDVAIDPANNVVYAAAKDNMGTVYMYGWKNAATVNGTAPTPDYSFTLSGYPPVALDPVHKKFYDVTEVSKTDADPIPMARYSYSSLSDLTGALVADQTLGLCGGYPRQLWLEPNSGDVWAATTPSGGQGCIAWQQSAYNAPNQSATAIYRMGTSQTFWGYTGIVYIPTNGGTIFAADEQNGGLAWLSNVAVKGSNTYDPSGTLSFGSTGQMALGPSGKLLVIVLPNSVQEYGLPNPSGNSLKTVSSSNTPFNAIQYVP